MQDAYYLLIHNSNDVKLLCLALLVTKIYQFCNHTLDFFLHRKNNSVTEWGKYAKYSVAKIDWECSDTATLYGLPPTIRGGLIFSPLI